MNKYYCLFRPPQMYTLPEGWESYTEWSPRETAPEFPERKFHGFAIYAEPLTFRQIDKWELLPADRGEFIRYWFYRDQKNDEVEGERYLDMLCALSDEVLQENIADGWPEAKFAYEYKHNFMGDKK